MARAAKTPEQIVRGGLTPTLFSVVAVDGISFPNDGETVIEVVNGTAGEVDVTMPTPNTVDGLAVADRVVAVPAAARRLIGPFPPAQYNRPDGTMWVDFEADMATSVGLYRLN